MIKLKTPEEIEIMKEAGVRLRRVMKELLPQVKPGITTSFIDDRAQALIHSEGGEPGFKKVSGYKWATCLPINEQIVHTPPSNRVLKNGDVLTIDIGLYYRGFHTDYSDTFIVGDLKNPQTTRFLEVGKKTLNKALEKVRKDNYLGEVSQTIQKEVESNGYFVIQELTGHGIGTYLHEEPLVPGILNVPLEMTIKIKPGLVIAIEVIYAMGTGKINFEKDNKWSIVTADSSLSAQFEKQIALTDSGPLTIT